ncbi:MAG: hypothetical protein ABIZ91_00505 [Gemmatimonadaceae bacterium]
MVLEIRAVGRKTPNDGWLEITADTARRLASLTSPFPLKVGDATGAAVMRDMSCTCQKSGTEGGHQHHFLDSPLFRSLIAERTAVVELLDDASLVVTSA